MEDEREKAGGGRGWEVGSGLQVVLRWNREEDEREKAEGDGVKERLEMACAHVVGKVMSGLTWNKT